MPSAMGNQRNSITLKERSRSLNKLKKLLKFTLSYLTDLHALWHSRCKGYQADIGQLLLVGQSEREVIRAEKVIREQNMLHVFEMIESYCNNVNERVCLLLEQRECPEEVREAAAGLTFVTSRFAESGDLPVLQDVRRIFTIFFGKEFADKVAQLRNCCVSGKQLKMPVAMNDFDAKSKATADFSNVDWQYLLQIDNLNKALSQEWEQNLSNIINKNLNINVSIMKEQHDMAMAQEKRRYEELAKLLKKAMEEKEKWEKVARETQIIVTAMKHAIKKGQQNYITRWRGGGL